MSPLSTHATWNMMETGYGLSQWIFWTHESGALRSCSVRNHQLPYPCPAQLRNVAETATLVATRWVERSCASHMFSPSRKNHSIAATWAATLVNCRRQTIINHNQQWCTVINYASPLVWSAVDSCWFFAAFMHLVPKKLPPDFANPAFGGIPCGPNTSAFLERRSMDVFVVFCWCQQFWWFFVWLSLLRVLVASGSRSALRHVERCRLIIVDSNENGWCWFWLTMLGNNVDKGCTLCWWFARAVSCWC